MGGRKNLKPNVPLSLTGNCQGFFSHDIKQKPIVINTARQCLIIRNKQNLEPSPTL